MKLYVICPGIIYDIGEDLLTCEDNFLLFPIINRKLKNTFFYFFKF